MEKLTPKQQVIYNLIALGLIGAKLPLESCVTNAEGDDVLPAKKTLTKKAVTAFVIECWPDQPEGAGE